MAVEEYRAVLDGARLRETIVYRVESGGYYMLYRDWRRASLDPAAAGEPGTVWLEWIACPPGSVPYTVDSSGRVKAMGRLDGVHWVILKSKVSEAGARNEAGCFFPGGLTPGTYTVAVEWTLYPPAACGGDGCYYRLSLADANAHLYYERAVVEVRGYLEARLKPGLERLAASVEEEDGVFRTVIAPLPPSKPLELLLVAPPGVVPEASRVDSALGKLEWEARWDQVKASVATLVLLAPRALIFIPPIAVVVAYARYGRERPPARPVPSGIPPDTGEKPWQVAVLYHGQPGVFDDNALAATVLGLAARGMVRVEEEGGRTVIRLPSEPPGDLDEAERAVLDFLRELSDGGVLYADEIPGKLRSPETAARARQLLGGLRGVARKLAEEALEKPPWLVPLGVLLFLSGVLLALAVAALQGSTWLPAGPSLVSSLLLAIAGAVLLVAPARVLGRWRPGYLENFLAWRMFREELRRRGAPPAAAQGSTALVAAYAAALGMGGLLEEWGLKDLHRVYNSARGAHRALYPGRGAGAR